MFICDLCTAKCIDIVVEELQELDGGLNDLPKISSIIREAYGKDNQPE